jgi:hypothetical protein
MHRIIYVQPPAPGKVIQFECLEHYVSLTWSIDRSGSLTIRTEEAGGQRKTVRTFADGCWNGVWGRFADQKVYCSDVPPST